MKRRILSVLTALALCLSLLPTTALAANVRTVTTASQLRDAVRNAGNGDTIKLGADITLSASDAQTVEEVYRFRDATQTTLKYDLVWQKLGAGWKDWNYRDEWGDKLYTGRFWENFNRINVITGKQVRWLDDDGYTIHQAVGDTTDYKDILEAICGLLVDGKSITLDLGGHTLTGNGGDKAPLYSLLFVRNEGHVTITGSGTMDSGGGTAVTVYGYKTSVQINSGNFKGNTSAVSAFGSAEVTITGGTFQGANWTERRFSWTVDERRTGDARPRASDDPYGSGSFVQWRPKIHEIIQYDYTAYGGTLYDEGGNFTISGNPTFKAPEGGAIFSNRGSGLTAAKIGGGTFEGKLHGLLSDSFGFQINGGTFTDKPYKNDLVIGYVLYGNGDRYTVKPQAGAAAKITSGSLDAYYATLSDAVSAVKDGETVTLLADYSGTVTLSKNSVYTLDMGDKTIYGSITASGGTVTLDNGTVTGNLSASGGELSVIGGRYANDPTQYVAEGYFSEWDGRQYYAVTANDNRTLEIWDADDLKEFADVVNGGKADQNAVLMADINLISISNWTPIGNSSIPYKGTFEGNGHSIENLKVNIPEKRAGLFGGLGDGGVIRNVHIKSGSIVGRVAGGIVGYSDGVIEDCSNAADVTGEDAGGIAGSMKQSVLGPDGRYYIDAADVYAVRCANSGNITGKVVYGVGLRVHDSYNTGKLTSTNGNLYGVGSSGEGKNCYNFGPIIPASDYYYVVYHPELLNGKGDKLTSPDNNYYLSSLSPGKDSESTAKTAAQFASGEVAYLLNGNKDAPNGPYYQNLTGPNADPYPVLDPTHAAVYKVGNQYVNYSYTENFAPIDLITVDGGVTMEQMVKLLREKLPKTIKVSSTGGSPSSAAVTWNTNSINYDPDYYGTQRFEIYGNARVTGLLGGGDKSVVAYIFVNPVELESQTVTTKPLLVYSQDGKLDLSSTKVTAKYANGAVKIWGYDTERVIFRLDGTIVKNGASLDKSQHNGKDLTIYYGGETVTLGRLTVNSTDNSIKKLTVGGTEVPYENGGYAITLPPNSSLPDANGIGVTLADNTASVNGKTEISTEGRVAHWEISVQAESGDVATYPLTVTVSPPYEELNQAAVDDFTAAWNSLSNIAWNPTQAEVQQDETETGLTHEQQLTYWLMNKLVEAGLEIPDKAERGIVYTSGPDWAVAGDRQYHGGTEGSFTFTLTFTATAGDGSQNKSVSFEGNAGTIGPISYVVPNYTVIFDSQGGSAVDGIQVAEDTPIGEPAAPTKAGHRFTGWYKESNCVNLWDFSEKVTVDNMTLYAGWRWSQSETAIVEPQRTKAANEDAVQAGAYGEGLRMGDTVSITASAKLTEEPGQTNTFTTEPENFKFYLGDPDRGGTLLSSVPASVQGESYYTATLEVDLTSIKGFAAGQNTIHVVFSGGDQLDGSRASTPLTIGKAMFTVTFSNTGDNSVDNQYVEDGGYATEFSDPTWTDHRFTGWESGGRAFSFSDPITKNTDLTATWEWAKSETGVTIDLVRAGNPDAPRKTDAYHIGDDVSIIATVKPAEQPSESNAISLLDNRSEQRRDAPGHRNRYCRQRGRLYRYPGQYHIGQHQRADRGRHL